MACELTRVLLDPICDFKGTAGQSVTLKVVGTVGNALFEAAEYGGTKLAGLPSDSITFTLHTGC